MNGDLVTTDNPSEISPEDSSETTFPPGVPRHDPDDPVEHAVIRRLVGNWHRRATVKRDEPDLDELFELERPDYPEGILPFHDHPTYQALDPEKRSEVLSWAWIAYNRHTVMAEQKVANPAFALVMEGEYPALSGEALNLSLAQAMVDEQYHTLMHLNASAVTRRRRGRAMLDTDLPMSHTARMHQQLRDAAGERWQRSLTTLAFATVSEISINAYLDLLADDTEIQSINSTTAKLHNRDEYCHASISAVLAEVVYEKLDQTRRRYFLDMLMEGLDAFVTNDYTTWHRIMDLAGVAGGHEMLADCQAESGRKRLVRDYTGLHKLVEQMGVTDQVDFDWSRSHISA
ncbi:AurF N-oxygenase family protein [Streptantibioticus ferralitis]|uniref:Diiron oxygenase n=1 Tax=Streptantibioticus ferralitis TaxID=236510 RepID=A0ABT5YXM0_9ACTN|nr:diiron oxygenase [Streptantibioticus ferralitis]MDF2256304.1 diiron oxygenase [Streptantibioticus ferralitis]